MPGAVNNSLIVQTPGVYYAAFTFAGCNNATSYFVLAEGGSTVLDFPVVINVPAAADSYQWYDDQVPVSGETAAAYSIKEEGEYYSETTAAHCWNESPRFFVRALFENQPHIAVDDEEKGDAGDPINSTVTPIDTDPDGDDMDDKWWNGYSTNSLDFREDELVP